MYMSRADQGLRCRLPRADARPAPRSGCWTRRASWTTRPAWRRRCRCAAAAPRQRPPPRLARSPPPALRPARPGPHPLHPPPAPTPCHPQTVRASSLNCYIFEALEGDTIETKASLLSQEYRLSDPCTFRLIVKNVTALSPPGVREAAYAQVRADAGGALAPPGRCCTPVPPAHRAPMHRRSWPGAHSALPTLQLPPPPLLRRWTRWC
jgi:hypothetical protein